MGNEATKEKQEQEERQMKKVEMERYRIAIQRIIELEEERRNAEEKQQRQKELQAQLQKQEEQKRKEVEAKEMRIRKEQYRKQEKACEARQHEDQAKLLQEAASGARQLHDMATVEQRMAMELHNCMTEDRRLQEMRGKYTAIQEVRELEEKKRVVEEEAQRQEARKRQLRKQEEQKFREAEALEAKESRVMGEQQRKQKGETCNVRQINDQTRQPQEVVRELLQIQEKQAREAQQRKYDEEIRIMQQFREQQKMEIEREVEERMRKVKEAEENQILEEQRRKQEDDRILRERREEQLRTIREQERQLKEQKQRNGQMRDKKTRVKQNGVTKEEARTMQRVLRQQLKENQDKMARLAKHWQDFFDVAGRARVTTKRRADEALFARQYLRDRLDDLRQLAIQRDQENVNPQQIQRDQEANPQQIQRDQDVNPQQIQRDQDAVPQQIQQDQDVNPQQIQRDQDVNPQQIQQDQDDNPQQTVPLVLPRVCAHHSSSGGCRDAECRKLHVCRQFLAGVCSLGADCRDGHSLATAHNRGVCNAYNWDVSREQELLHQLSGAFEQPTETVIVESLETQTRQRGSKPAGNDSDGIGVHKYSLVDAYTSGNTGHQDDGGAAAASATGAVPRTTPPGPGAGLSMDLLCPICMELFNQATTLGCGHTFCAGCLQGARAKIGGSGGDRCPLCRAPVTSAIRSVTLDNIVRSIASDGSYYEVYV